MTKTIEIIGGGCAGFSLIKRAKELKGFEIKLYTDIKETENYDHYWGFWNTKKTTDAFKNSEKIWYKWKIITEEKEKLFETSNYPYCAISRKKWINNCRILSKNFNVKIVNQKVIEKNNNFYAGNEKLAGDFIFDSRQPKIKNNILLQHFHGLTLDFEEDVFDENIAVLMDFRCDQSRGIHFIYLLPFSKTKALIESTMFSKKIEDYNFYINSIKSYITRFYKTDKYKIVKEESGVIPMNYICLPNKNSINIGVRGGATRPSSGYTFSFIQQQVDKIVRQIKENRKITNVVHNRFNLLMDKIFLDVIEKNKLITPNIFYNLSSSLSGDEMAQFMLGKSKSITWLKVINKMPKFIFLSSLISVLING